MCMSTQQKQMDYTNLMWVASLQLHWYHSSCNPVNYRYYLKLATVTYYMNLIIYSWDKWYTVHATMPVCYSQTRFDVV